MFCDDVKLVHNGLALLKGLFFFFSSRRRHTRYWRDWSSDVCSSDLLATPIQPYAGQATLASKSSPTTAARSPNRGRVARMSEASDQVETLSATPTSDRKSVV